MMQFGVKPQREWVNGPWVEASTLFCILHQIWRPTNIKQSPIVVYQLIKIVSALCVPEVRNEQKCSGYWVICFILGKTGRWSGGSRLSSLYSQIDTLMVPNMPYGIMLLIWSCSLFILEQRWALGLKPAGSQQLNVSSETGCHYKHVHTAELKLWYQRATIGGLVTLVRVIWILMRTLFFSFFPPCQMEQWWLVWLLFSRVFTPSAAAY